MLGLFVIYMGSNFISFVISTLYKIKIFEAFQESLLASLFLNIANIVNFSTFFGLIFLIYHVMAPRTNKKFINTIVLTSIISFIFMLLKSGFSYIIFNLAQANPIYGAFGSIVSVLAWLFISFNIILIGARAIYYLELVTFQEEDITIDF